MTPVRLMIAGAAGRMSRMIIAAAATDPAVALVSGTEITGSPDLGRDMAELSGLTANGIRITGDLEGAVKACDVIIDFTSQDAAMDNLDLAVKNRKKMVIGITGLDNNKMDRITEAARKTAIVYSPNMSVGVNLLFRLVEEAAKVLADYDIEIIEAHHRMKIDAPSGTAMKLAEIVASQTGKDITRDAVHGRHGLIGARKKNEIGMHAVRAGDIVGDHTVLFCTDGERIELKHQAHSRMTFAMGAVRAARFLADRSSGLFTMKEVLGL